MSIKNLFGKIAAVAIAAAVTAGCALYSAPTAEMLRAMRVHAATADDLTFRIVSIASGEAPIFSVDGSGETTAARTTVKAGGNTTNSTAPYRYAVLTKCDSYASGTLEIPSEYEGVPVLEIAASAFNNRCYDLEKVVVPNSVVSIRNRAFANCEKLKEVVLPKNLLGISDSVFYGCTSLAQVILPDSITVIGDRVFSGCVSLKSVSIPDSVTKFGNSDTKFDGVFYKCTSLEFVKLPSQIREIPPYTFYNCSALKDIIIPEGVSRIEDSAFYQCASLESISLPASVTTVRNMAFFGCDSLTSITFHNPECMIGNNILSYSSSVTIYGECGSTAETYANDYKYTFKPLEDAPKPEIPENTLPKAPEGSVFGDVTGDGNVTVEDAQCVLKFYVESFAGNKPTWYSVTGNPDAPV